ncbi:MAG: translation elongation factor-like protein [Patescibacteria group bacterium]
MPNAKTKPAAKKPKAVKKSKPIGVVTHYFGHLEVAIVKFSTAMRVGDAVHFKGATTDFTENIKSMQFDHKPIDTAKKGQEVGIKVDGKVREGDEVYATE